MVTVLTDFLKMKSFIISQLVLALFFTTHLAAQNQGSATRRDSKQAEQEEGVTIRGRIIQGTKLETFHVDLSLSLIHI